MIRRVILLLLLPTALEAATIHGRVTDTMHGALPGVTVEIRRASPPAPPRITVTDREGRFAADVDTGHYDLTFRLLDFATVVKRNVDAGDAGVSVTLQILASAEIVVTGKKTFRNLAEMNQPINDLIGMAGSANEGVITSQQIEARPTQRAGDLLESVPGVIVSQHSGEGKANQYYLRGFNLDHGTDLAITVAGLPVNMPTHAHGQGYADPNFLIPELVSGVQYRKGPYYAEEGDFSSAGAVNVNYANSLETGIASLDVGQFGYRRALLAASPRVAGGHFLYAVEAAHNDGPWTNEDRYRKLNGLLRYSRGDEENGFSINAMGYSGRWRSTDQIPSRAISPAFSRFDSIDPTDGGDTHRYSLSAAWQLSSARALTKANVYAIDYALDLASNFTYFLDDPVNGDQFLQRDRRTVTGAALSRQWLGRIGDVSLENSAGVDIRNDNIPHVGLFRTRARDILSTVRDDSVVQTSASLYAQSTSEWSTKFRTITGLRADAYRFSVDSNNAANSGQARASLLSPKLTAIAGPWGNTELYVNAGYGFHSNDGRGATLNVDPASGDPARRVSPLVRTKGSEVGVRSTAVPHVQTTFSLWSLDVASELVFSGDAGTTEPSRPSRRSGIEWANFYRPDSWITIDGDIVWSHGRFADDNAAGRRIPGAPETIISAGVVFTPADGFSASLRYRYFGSRPLIEDNSVRSHASRLVSARAEYEVRGRYRLRFEIVNMLDAATSDIDYFYRSRLPGEPAAGIEGVHTHPVEPRSLRIGVSRSF